MRRAAGRPWSAARRWSRWAAGAGIGAIIAALAWPACQGAATAPPRSAALLSAIADGQSGAANPDTITPSTNSVAADQTVTLTFTYAEASSTAATSNTSSISVALQVPGNWTAPSPGNVTCPTKSCDVTVADSVITVVINPDITTTFTLEYTGTAPASAMTSSFAATETLGTQSPSALSPPQVTVNCPDGQGTMTGPASTVTAGSTVSLSFTYTAGSCGTGPGGEVALAVPNGWTAPSTASGAAGFVTAAGGGGPPTTDGQTITVPAASLAPGGTVSIAYELASAPAVAAGYTFAAAEESSDDGNLVALATSPQITVTPSGANSSPTAPQHGQSAPPQAGLMTVRPAQVLAGQLSTLTFSYAAPRTGLPASSEITVEVPAGWTAPSASASSGQPGYARSDQGELSVLGRQLVVTDLTLAAGQDLTVTYAGRAAPSAAGPSTFAASVRSGRAARLTALRVSPEVTVALAGAAGGPGRWLVIVLVVVLVVAAAAAGVLVRRRIGRKEWAGPGPNIQTVPHPGAPPSVAIRDTGKRPTLTVHIEPHASAVSTTIREGRL